MLLAFSVLPATLGMSGMLYGAGALVLGLLMLAPGVTLARSRSIGDARRLLRASVLYLPLLFLLSVVDRGL